MTVAEVLWPLTETSVQKVRGDKVDDFVHQTE